MSGQQHVNTMDTTTSLEDEKDLYNDKDVQVGTAHVLEVGGEGDAANTASNYIELGATEAELERLNASLPSMTLEKTVAIIKELVVMHAHDQNFSGELLQSMKDFLADPSVMTTPEKHSSLIRLMKIEAIMATENSPYVEVRANVDPTDDPNTPVSTVRAWFIGIIFSAIGTFIDTLFAFRNPGISIGVNVAQMLAYPLGKFLARVLPDKRFHFFGEHSLNPGPFNQKEHMLISIMASISFQASYTFYIIPVQAMPQYFNMPFGYDRGYQLLISLATNLFGYGMAGLLRRFLVYPSVAIWPSSLSTVALIKAFHDGNRDPVPGPFNRLYSASMGKIFLWATVAMAIYYMFPGYIFQALSSFSWMTWIAPDNVNLNAITGNYGGLGLNPVPTFDWNFFGGSGLYLPTFVVLNQFAGILIAAGMIIAIWYSNAWNTGFLPINSNHTYDNTGARFNGTAVLDATGRFDESAYEAYSQPFFSAGYIVYNMWAFASYTASLSYVYLFYRHEVMRGFKGVYRSFFKRGESMEELEEDVHYRLMRAYKEVPEWWYAVLLVIPIAFGCAAVSGYPTEASPAALFYGLILPAIFIVPIGIIQAVTGTAVPLNTLAAILGGLINAGNPNGLIYFKVWAYLSSWQALSFCNDLKLAHYSKIPPRITFTAQVVATLVFSVVSSFSYNFIMDLPNVCTDDAAFRFTCPYQTSYYTITIFWGVISPKKLFGAGQRYNMMLLGFPLGFLLVGIYWLLRRQYPRSAWVRSIHPVMICSGPVSYAAPYNLAYFLGNVYINLFSFHYIRKHYVAFWARWNYIIYAAFSTGIALAALFIFFALELPKGGTLGIDWWGNNVPYLGCEGDYGCPRLAVPDEGYFGPAPGTFH